MFGCLLFKKSKKFNESCSLSKAAGMSAYLRYVDDRYVEDTSYFCFVIFVENIHDVIAYDCVDILLSTLTCFNVISVEFLVKGAVFWKMDIY